MFKHILLAGALALLAPLAQASTAETPAWGLIIKLKDGPTPSSTTAPQTPTRAQAQAQQQAHARLQTALRHTSLPQTAHRALGGQAIHHIGTDRLLTPAQAQALSAQLLASGEIEWAVPNRRMKRLSTPAPNDYFLGSGIQWWALSTTSGTHLRGVPNLLSAWTNGSTGSSGTIVAVLDTGLISHEDLTPSRILPGRNFHHGITSAGTIDAILDQPVSDYSDPGDGLTQDEKDANPTRYANCDVEPSSWHGTAVTGMIAATANNTSGIAGANWGVRILPVRIAGKCGAWTADILEAMYWVAGDSDNGNIRRADIVNLSFGSTAPCDDAHLLALNFLKKRGVTVIIAAGNDQEAASAPANCVGRAGTENVASVAALTRDGAKASYSNFGTEITFATVGGEHPGVDSCNSTMGCIVTLGNSGTTTRDTHPASQQYFYYTGTSLAAPIASGIAALVLSANPNLTADQVISTLRLSARAHLTPDETGLPTCSTSNAGQCSCDIYTCGSGILDASRAVQMAIGNPPAGIASANQQRGGESNSGGGGGALGGGSLLALVLFAAVVARGAKQRS